MPLLPRSAVDPNIGFGAGQPGTGLRNAYAASRRLLIGTDPVLHRVAAKLPRTGTEP
jgi:hypothetical protein